MTKFQPAKFAAAILALALVSGCSPRDKREPTAPAETRAEQAQTATAPQQPVEEADSRFDIYVPVVLNADLSGLSDNQRRMIGLLIDASRIMDRLFWLQSYGPAEELLSSIEDSRKRKFAEINYGPWDRLNNNEPFIEGYGPKPPGAQFYPQDMTKAEFDAWQQPGKDGLYSLVRRNEKGELELVPYREAYKAELEQAAQILQQASELAEDERSATTCACAPKPC